MEQDRDIMLELQDAIMEKPYCFTVNDKYFYIYPVSLGKSFLLSNLLQSLCLDTDNLRIDPALEILKAVQKRKDIACQIVAICTARNKNEVFNAKLMSNRAEYFKQNTSDTDLTEVIMLLFSYDKVQLFTEYLGLDKEQKEQAKIAKLKNDKGSSITYGGKSTYGSLIGIACEKYGWTVDYAVWGISYVNLRMIIADSINSVYLTDEERKKAHIVTDQEIVDMNNPNDSWALIKSMNWA